MRLKSIVTDYILITTIYFTFVIIAKNKRSRIFRDSLSPSIVNDEENIVIKIRINVPKIKFNYILFKNVNFFFAMVVVSQASFV